MDGGGKKGSEHRTEIRDADVVYAPQDKRTKCEFANISMHDSTFFFLESGRLCLKKAVKRLEAGGSLRCPTETATHAGNFQRRTN